jgi:hypothetical protein
MGDSFYHIFATLYLLFIRNIKSLNFNFVNKLRKIDVWLWRHNQHGIVQGAKWRVWRCVGRRNTRVFIKIHLED